MKALLFPGQGSQFVGMGKDLFDDFNQCKEIFLEADELLGYKLSEICFNGPEEILKQTENTQPALYVHSMAIFQLLKELDIKASAGHSLGEYSALTSSGLISFQDGLSLVRLRGKLMQESGRLFPGTMAAIVGLSENDVIEICYEAGSKGIVQPANFNSPGQIVISGSIEGVRFAIELAKKKGSKLAKELVVSGAFHSPLMNYAFENITEALNNLKMNEFLFDVYSNVTAQKFSSKNEVPELLKKQILMPVRWQQIIENMYSDGIRTFIEIGAGKVLTGLVKRTKSDVETINIGNSKELLDFLDKWKK